MVLGGKKMSEQPIVNKQTQPNVVNKTKFFKKQATTGLQQSQQQSPQTQQIQQQPQKTPQTQQMQQSQQQKQPQFKK